MRLRESAKSRTRRLGEERRIDEKSLFNAMATLTCPVMLHRNKVAQLPQKG
ncbi:MAG TPA: hypothetical protein VH684_29445 [Xanthobacteraceae bacterium]|jgi:hypothetical protein